MNERSIFEAAIERESPQERAAYLDSACGGDSNLRARVDQLLREFSAPDPFLDAPPSDLARTVRSHISEQTGTVIGPYKLREQIGEGGFGIVYLAEQTEPVKRRVALKIIKPGMDTREVVSRFQAERQALALMDHPNIAKVLDAGATESSRPYFVMELVKGIPVTEYCDQCQLSTRDRLELFVQICRAIQHAHQKGIIHRDVKPSNVLVAIQDGHPLPKVIDFGVAKAINQQLTDQTLLTRFAQIVGTPLYMSPEQAEMSALDVDTRSDIYSLGVLLYELLTGTTPFERQRLKDATYDEVRRIIREEEPVRPSARISTLGADVTTIAEKRRTEPRKLQQFVRGDLDWIALKALEKDRTRRYETAASFAEDINRFLNDEPVSACPPSAAYRLRKFARRNRLAMVTSTIVACSIVVLAIGASIAAVKFEDLAERNANLAEDKEALADERGRLAEDLASALESAESNLELAVSEQARAEDNLDLSLAALDAVYLDAIGEEKLLGEPLSRPDHNAPSPLLTVQPLTDLERDLLQRGLGFYEQFALNNVDTPTAQVHAAQAFYRVGMVQSGLGDHAAAQVAFREAIRRFDELTKQFPDDVEYYRQLAESYRGLARSLPNWSDARRFTENSLTAYSEVIRQDPDDPQLYLTRAALARNLGDQQQRSDDLRSALELGPDNVAVLLACSDFHQWTEKNYQRALDLAKHAVERAPDSAAVHCRLAWVYGWMNHVVVYPDRRVMVVRDEQSARRHFDRAVELAPEVALATRGGFLECIGDYTQALEDLDRAIELNPSDSSSRLTRVRVLRATGDLDRALQELKVLEQSFPHHIRDILEYRTAILLQQQEWELALESVNRGIEFNESADFGLRAFILIQLNRYAEALEDLTSTSSLGALKDRHVDVADTTEEFQAGLKRLMNRVAEESPSSEAFADRAWLHSELGEFTAADDDFRKACELAPDYSNTWTAWGRDLLTRRQYQSAREKFKRATECDSDFWIKWWDHAVACAALHDFDAAVDSAERAITLGAGSNVFYAVALCHLKAGNTRQYRDSCATMLERFGDELPGDVWWTTWTCSLAPQAVDDYSTALALATHATEAEPDSDRFLHILGTVLHRAGRHDEALQKLTRLADRMEQPDYVTGGSPAYTWYFLAMTHHALGHTDDANSWLDKANERTEQELTDEDGSATWFRRLTLDLLRDEATSLINPDPSENETDDDNETSEAPSPPDRGASDPETEDM